jgi:hypothetical protein
MQVCPECGTQYEDHVPTCIADGVRLVSAAAVPEPKPARPAQASPPPRSRASAGIPVVLALAAMGGGGLAALVGGVFLWSQLGAHGRTQPVPPPPPPSVVAPAPALTAPVPPPAPAEPIEQPAVQVALASSPDGAKVYENDQFVCEAPCTIEHPPHAPLPRTFVFRLSGYRDATFEMTDAKAPISIQMSRARGAPAPANPTSTVPRPTIGRDR